MNQAVRFLIRTALGMPDNSVRPAGQTAPAGGQIQEIATVNILDSDEAGYPGVSVEDDGHGGTVVASEVPEIFVASVNFYRAPTKDAVGIATYSNAAFDRAARLPQILQKPSNVEIMGQLGLGLLTWSKPRNLRGLADATWESRGQIDLTFNIINRETDAVDTIGTVPITTTMQPGGTRTSNLEVTP